jgi:hypothetical protein
VYDFDFIGLFAPFRTGNHISLVILLIVTFVKHIKPVKKEREKLDRIIKVAKERVEKYFEDPEDELAIKGFEGAKKWATENNIKEVLEQISIYEKACFNLFVSVLNFCVPITIIFFNFVSV